MPDIKDNAWIHHIWEYMWKSRHPSIRTCSTMTRHRDLQFQDAISTEFWIFSGSAFSFLSNLSVQLVRTSLTNSVEMCENSRRRKLDPEVLQRGEFWFLAWRNFRTIARKILANFDGEFFPRIFQPCFLNPPTPKRKTFAPKLTPQIVDIPLQFHIFKPNFLFSRLAGEPARFRNPQLRNLCFRNPCFRNPWLRNSWLWNPCLWESPSVGFPYFGIPSFGIPVSEFPPWESLLSELPPSEFQSKSGTP